MCVEHSNSNGCKTNKNVTQLFQVPVEECDYLIDLDFPLHPISSALEPRYATMDETWERVACYPFLDAKHSFILTRILCFQVRDGGVWGLLFAQELEENGDERNKGQEISLTWIRGKGKTVKLYGQFSLPPNSMFFL